MIESSTASNFPFKRTVPMDFSQSFQDEPTVAQLRAKAQAYINQSGVGIPKVSIKLSFVSLADTEEYKSVAALQAVNLCDNINVYFEKLNISATGKIVKTVYDVLLEKYDSLEIGSLKSTLASTISGQDSALSTLANNTQRMFKQYNNTVNEMIDTATAWLTKGDGYVVAVKNTDGSWKELLFMDTADMETAHNVLRVNQNGIGFSSTGVAGPYTQAWTLDGRMVIGGTNVPSLTVYDNQQNILFRIDNNGLQWNAPNSSMTTAGVLSMNGGSIDAGTVTGATIRTDDEGSRIVLDSSSSVKGYYNDTLHNIINMSNRDGNNNNLIIDADHQLHIRTPQIFVNNQSYGTGSGTVYETRNNSVEFVQNVTKDTEGRTELYLANVGEDEGDVYCTLPVILNVEYGTYTIKNGMWITGHTERSEAIN